MGLSTFDVSAPKATPNEEDASQPDKGRELEKVEVDLGDDLEGMVTIAGEHNVFAAAKRHFVVNVQNIARAGLEAGDSEVKVRETVSNWVAGETVSRQRDPIAASIEKMAGMSPEDQQAIFAQMQEAIDASNAKNASA